jgi:conjugative transfer signal peptidase TraF
MIRLIFALRARSSCGQKRPVVIPILTLFGLGLIALPALDSHTPLIVWNASASACIGLYRVLAGAATRGDLVLIHTPDSIRQLADERGYLPANVPMLKRIAGANGDIVCAAGNAIFINGRLVADRLMSDGLGRPLPHWSGCHLLSTGEAFLLMEGVTNSFDSRYFGPITTSAIIGRLAPLWVD